MMITHKRVNIISKKGLPLYFLNISSSSVYNITLPLSSILMAIQMDCLVEEETNNGRKILTLNNFDKDLYCSKYEQQTSIKELESSKNKENRKSLINKIINEQNIISGKKI